MVKDHSDSEKGNLLLIGYSYRLTARVLLYAPSHRQDNTYHSLCYTSRGALAGTRTVCFSPVDYFSSWLNSFAADSWRSTTQTRMRGFSCFPGDLLLFYTYTLEQRCQPGTTHICKIMTKNPCNLQKKSLQIVNTIAKHNFGKGSRCNTPIYNKQTNNNLLCHRSFTFVFTKHSWCHCKLTTVRI